MGATTRHAPRFRMHAVRPARRIAAALGVIVASALLASCASPPSGFGGPITIADEEGLGWPADAPLPQRQGEGPVEPVAWWNLGDTRETLTFISYGSSSCPFTLTALEVVAADRLSATFVKEGAAGPCTEDLAPRFHVIAAPEGLTAPEVLADVKWRSPAGADDSVQDFTVVVIDPNVEAVIPPASVAIDEYPGLPSLLPEPPPDSELPDGPRAYWLSPVPELGDARELTIVTYGSSSCPVIPTALDPGLAPDAIGITLEERRAPDTFCTQDYGPYTSVLEVPVAAAAGATAVIVATIGPVDERSERRIDIVDLAG